MAQLIDPLETVTTCALADVPEHASDLARPPERARRERLTDHVWRAG